MNFLKIAIIFLFISYHQNVSYSHPISSDVMYYSLKTELLKYLNENVFIQNSSNEFNQLISTCNINSSIKPVDRKKNILTDLLKYYDNEEEKNDYHRILKHHCSHYEDDVRETRLNNDVMKLKNLLKKLKDSIQSMLNDSTYQKNRGIHRPRYQWFGKTFDWSDAGVQRYDEDATKKRDSFIKTALINMSNDLLNDKGKKDYTAINFNNDFLSAIKTIKPIPWHRRLTNSMQKNLFGIRPIVSGMTAVAQGLTGGLLGFFGIGSPENRGLFQGFGKGWGQWYRQPKHKNNINNQKDILNENLKLDSTAARTSQ